MDSSTSVQQPFPSDQDASGRSFDGDELAFLEQVLRSGTLTSTKGQWVRRLEQAFAASLEVPHAVACSSGTAGLHAAIAALDLEPGEEIITTPITDMGALAPLLYQGVIPVFADVDAATCNVTAETIGAGLSGRTRAIIVTHLFGNPCDMVPIMKVAREHGLPVIEDCSQAFMAADAGRAVGTIGDVGVFSLQQGKHITSGEGGLIVCRDEAMARRMRTFINKAWDYADPAPDHRSLALNYRLSELQGAVAFAQLARLPAFVQVRRDRAQELSNAIEGWQGVAAPMVRAAARHSYWRYGLRVDPSVGATALGRELAARGISAAPRYIRKPAFECEVFAKQKTFGASRWPFTLARPQALDYSRERFPGVCAGLDGIVVLPWNEKLTASHVERLASALGDALDALPYGTPR